jgi:hypothetical protein
MVMVAALVAGVCGTAMGQLSDKFNEAKDLGLVDSFVIDETVEPAKIQFGEATAQLVSPITQSVGMCGQSGQPP